MLRQFLVNKIIVIVGLWFLLCTLSFAQTTAQNTVALDHKQMITQQLSLLNDRLQQAQNELAELQRQQEAHLSYDKINTQLLNQIGLNIVIAKSNSDSINIELIELQQTIERIEKRIQDAENQLNVLNVFRLKFYRNSAAPNISALQSELNYQKELLNLEKSRAISLQKLIDIHDNILQSYKAQYRRVSMILKSRTMMRLHEEQEKTEWDFQHQQTYWLQQLTELYGQLHQAEASANKSAVEKIENEIFFANENVNFTYVQMLIARYQDQMHQYRASILHSTSINFLNKVSDQTQLLGKQLERVNDLLKTRITILEKRKGYVEKEDATQVGLNSLQLQYKASLDKVTSLNQQLTMLHNLLNNAMQQELSARQGLPGFGTKAWLDLGQEILWVPTLTFQVFKSLLNISYRLTNEMTYQWSAFLLLLEGLFLVAFYLTHLLLKRSIALLPDHTMHHATFKNFSLVFLKRNLIGIAILANLYGLFTLCQIPPQSFDFILYLGLVWLFFKMLISAARFILVETVQVRFANDVHLYRRLKTVLMVGAVVTALSVFIYQLPMIYEVKDLFDRLFLLYVFIVSILLMKSWSFIPQFVLAYVDERHKYLKKVVYLLAIFTPLILLSNSAIGLFGFMNLVLTMTWYECVFMLVLIGYLIARGVLIDVMERASHILIRHVTNGWLWTEAFLKPIDKVLRIAIFLSAWMVLFIAYGWDQQSPVVERLTKLMHHNILSVLNTTITPLSVIEVVVITSLLFWAARWTREFVYRFLLSRTKDAGLRNSLAILSQYFTIIVGVLIILRVLGIDYKTLSVVAGMFFFGVGLGLRDLFNNFACGFLLLIERPIRVGDVVTINGYDGDVIHIGSRAVIIRTDNHQELIIPNADIFGKSFINWTAKDNIVRLVFHITINREDNPQFIQKLVYEVLTSNKNVLKEPAPEVYIKTMSHEIDFAVNYYINVRQVPSRSGLTSEILSAIWQMFEKHNIKTPYSHHEIYVKNKMTSMLASQ